MKYLLVLLLPFALTACGSSGKKAAKKEAEKVEAQAKQAEQKAEKKAKAAAGSVADSTCKLNNDSRRLEVVRSESGCVLQYTKDGSTNEIASGGVGSNHCQAVADRIKGNLTQAGFSCN